MDVAADLADVALYFLFGGGLDMREVVFVRYALFRAENLCLGDLGYEHHMSAAVNGLAHLCADECVGVCGNCKQSVIGSAGVCKILKLILISAADKSKALENLKGGAFGKDAYVEYSGILYHLTGEIFLIYRDADLLWGVGYLYCRVYNTAVISVTVLCGENEKSVGKLKHSGVINIAHKILLFRYYFDIFKYIIGKKRNAVNYL